MLRLPPARLLAGVAATLEHDVLPALEDRAVRGLVFAALEVLATVKMAAIMLTGIHAWREGRTRDLRMALFDHQWAYMSAAIAQARGFL